mmetsp:Transcript_62860/g.168398  ORF Transcript_62860/g.168398 Transcript_62860/m.168398 type:complete len:263 (-) Transcript_62860:143-931(-)
MSVVVIQNFALFRSANSKSSDDQPRTFLVLYVRANLTEVFRATETIQIIVLNLEIFAHSQTDFPDFIQRSRLVHPCEDQPSSHRHIKRVERSLVLDNHLVALHSEAREVQPTARSFSCHIQKLAHLSLHRNLVKETDKAWVGRMVGEVLFDEKINTRLKNKSVIHCHHPHLRKLVPARLSTPCNRIVHDVIKHQETGLKEFDAPTNNLREKDIFWGHFPLLNFHHISHGRHHRNSSGHLPTFASVLAHFLNILESFGRKLRR